MKRLSVDIDRNRAVRRAISAVAIFLLAVSSSGCRLALDDPLAIPSSLFSSVTGWNLSACTSGSGLRTCTQLFADNQELLLNGRTAEEIAVEGVLGFLTSLSDARVSVGPTVGSKSRCDGSF